MNKEKLWQAVLAQIQFSVSKANFATWLKNTYILSKEGGSLTVSVPNNFSKEWLENKYNKIIFKILYELDSEIKEVTYTVSKAEPKAQEIPLSKSPIDRTQPSFPELQVNKATNLNSKYSFDNYVVGPFNELAHAASLAITKSPGSAYNPFFVYGGVGLGKTHLLQAIGNVIVKEFPQKKVKYVSSEKFTSDVVSSIKNKGVDAFRALYRSSDVLIIDDVQFLAKKEKTQEELFHTFNNLYEHGKQIIFSSDRPPKAIPAIEERLRSRFEGGMIADITAPDFETRMAILKTKTEDVGMQLSDEVCDYIVSNIQRNIRELEGALTKILAFYRLSGETPSVAETKSLLRSIIQNPSRSANPKKILEVVSEFYDLTEKELIQTSRRREVVRPRQIAMYLLREELKSSYPFIGKRFGGKDHTTAIYACEKIAKELQNSEFLTDEINLIKQRIYGG